MFSKTPKKVGKYRNFLSAILQSPIAAKKSRQKWDVDQRSAANVSVVDENNDPLYSTIKNLNCEYPESQEPSFKLSITNLEPLYATVKKKSNRSEISPGVESNIKKPQARLESESSSIENKRLSSLSAESSDDKDETYPKETTISSHFMDEKEKLIQEHKEEIKVLTARIKEIAEENRTLQKRLHEKQKEDTWKEDTAHAQLRLKVTQLETETRKEVKSLTEQLKILDAERKLLSNQLHELHNEKLTLQKKYSEICERCKTMISPSLHTKALEQQRKLLQEIKRKHLEEVHQLQEHNKVITDSKDALKIELNELKGELNSLKAKKEAFETQEIDLQHDKDSLKKHLEESKHQEHEAQKLLLSVLKLAENLAVERDILLNKADFQESQQKEIQMSVIAYSLNIGRLQEHVTNFKKRNCDELLKMQCGLQSDDTLKQSYEKQMEMLREKVVSQSRVISELENQKSTLELHLEGLWQSTCNESFHH